MWRTESIAPLYRLIISSRRNVLRDVRVRVSGQTFVEKAYDEAVHHVYDFL